MTTASDDLSKIAEPVARALFGDPNKRLSNSKELRFGSNGSWSIRLDSGIAYSHELKQGGGVLWLLEVEKGLKGAERFEWLRQHGFEVGERQQRAAGTGGKGKIVATYDYTDEAGDLLFQVCRFENDAGQKTFLQRRKPRPDDDPAQIKNGWVWSVKGTKQVPYRLADLTEAIALGRQVVIVEGEKDVERLATLGITATCNAGGAGKWPKGLSEFFRDADVVMIPDNDEPGENHIALVGKELNEVVSSIRVARLPGLPPKGDASDFLNAGHPAEELQRHIAEAPEWLPNAGAAETGDFHSKMGLRMWADQNVPGPEYEYLIEDLIPEQQGVLLMGETQTGKSFLTFTMAMCGARGIPFFGRRILKPFGVVWCAYEAGEGAPQRMRAYRNYHGLSLDPLPFAALTRPLKLWPEETSVDAVIAEIQAIEREKFGGVKLGMVVIDTHNAGTPGASEIDSEVVSKIRDRYHKIIAATGASLVIVGHTNSQGKHRGNEQLGNNIDTVIKVTMKTRPISPREVVQLKDDEGHAIRSMKVVKQREGQSGDEHDFVLRVVEDGTKNKFGKARTSCVVAAPKIADAIVDGTPPSGGSDAGAHASRLDALFLECVLDATESDGVPPPASIQLPRSIAKVVDYEFVKRLMSQRTLREDDDTEEGRSLHRGRVKTALRRARERLFDARVIGTNSPFIWWTGKPVRGMKRTQPRRDMFSPADDRPDDLPDSFDLGDFQP